jgi:hypothetical protein
MVVDGPAAEGIASRVTSSEVVPLVSRTAWLATGSGGVGTVTTLGLQFGTADHEGKKINLPKSVVHAS